MFIKNLLWIIMGAAAVILPVLIYLNIVDAFSAFLDVSLFFNSKYSSLDFSIIGFYKFLRNVFNEADRNFVCFAFIILGLTSFCIKNKFINNFGKAGLILSFILLNYGIYIELVQMYYFLGAATFCIFGIIAVIYFFENNLKIIINNNLCFISCIFFLFLALHFNGNFKSSILFNRTAPVQIKFAYEMHNRSDNPTLLNFGSLDGGFYTYAEILPNVRFFQQQNISYKEYPLNKDTQINALKNRETEFVVYRQFADKPEPDLIELHENYDLISSQKQTLEGWNFIYYLYTLKK